MEALLQAIEAFRKKEGIDVLGFAPKSRFKDVPAEKNPFSIFPEGETVIMLGKRICRGSLRGVEEGTNFNDYNLFGSVWLEDEFLALACYDLTCLIENFGWEACPVFPNPSEVGPMGVSVGEGRPAPNVFPNFDLCAVAAGVAELSYSGIALTPEFGSRQRFHMVITDAKLPATPLLSQRICDSCGKCAKICPMGAISETESETINVCGKVMTVEKINYDLCRICKNGAKVNRMASKAKPDRVAALCNRTCLCHLEECGRITNTFENKFRQNQLWAQDRDGNPVDVPEL